MGELITLKSDEEKSLISEISEFWATFKQDKIENHDGYQLAATRRGALKDHIKQLEKVRKGHTQPIDELKKQVLAYFKTHEDVLSRALTAMDGAMVSFLNEVEAARRREQEELERVIREKAAEEKKKLEAQALEALKKGNEVKAEAILVKAEQEPAIPILAAPKVKAEGVATREKWSYEIVDRDLVPDIFWVIDEAKLGVFVRSDKGATKIEGVRVYSEKIIAGR